MSQGRDRSRSLSSSQSGLWPDAMSGADPGFRVPPGSDPNITFWANSKLSFLFGGAVFSGNMEKRGYDILGSVELGFE